MLAILVIEPTLLAAIKNAWASRDRDAQIGEKSTPSDQRRHGPPPHRTCRRSVEDWGKLWGDTAAVSALLDRLLHHGHVLQCGPRSYRTQPKSSLPAKAASR